MPPLDNTLSPEEVKFFETGELQPGMTPTPNVDPPPTPEAHAANPPVDPPPPPPSPMPPAPSPNPQINNEAAEILRQSLAEAQRRVGELEANIANIQKTPQPPAEVEPGDDDPLGKMMFKLNQVTKVVTDLQSQLQQQQEQQSQLTQFEQFRNQVNALRAQFAEKTPDFGDAYNHLRGARVADLKMLGYTDADITKAVFQEEVVLSQNAIKMGKNPAEVVYEMAKRHGYVPKGAAPASAPLAPNDKLTAIQQAQEASKNLPSTPQLDDITLEGLKGASDADLNKLVNDPNMWAKITGADQHPI